jgi:hypothetical protein
MKWDSKDLASALTKLEQCKAGGWVGLTTAEMEAHIAFTRSTGRIEEKTMDLRYITVAGMCVLQQRIVWYSLDRTTGGQEWRNVPVIHDTDAPTSGDRPD